MSVKDWKKERKSKEEKEKVIFEYYQEDFIRYFPFISHDKKHGALGWHVKNSRGEWEFIDYDSEQSVDDFRILVSMRKL